MGWAPMRRRRLRGLAGDNTATCVDALRDVDTFAWGEVAMYPKQMRDSSRSLATVTLLPGTTPMHCMELAECIAGWVSD